MRFSVKTKTHSAYVILTVTSFLLFARPTAAGPNQLDVTLPELAPLQTDAGFAEVHEKAETWIHEATLRAETLKVPVREELVKILNDEGRAGFTAYISPDGKIRPDDGHHKVLAALETMKRYEIDPSEVKWSVQIEKNYSGESWGKFAADMKEKGLGYFSDDVLEKSHRLGESPGELYKNGLPENFSKLRDSPMRSAVGKIFDSLDIKGSAFRPYIQFIVGQKMADIGVKVAPNEEFSPEVQTRLRRELFEGTQSKELQHTLLSNALPERRPDISKKLRTGRERFSRVQASTTTMGSSESCIATKLQGLMSDGVALPSAIRLPADPANFRSLFNQAELDFSEQVDLDRIRHLTEAIAKQGGSGFTGPDRKYMKEARKNALVLRAAYRILSKDSVPASYQDFVRNLGELNDLISKWNLRDKPPLAIVDEAEKVRKILDKESLFDKSYSTVGPKKFAKRQKKNIAWLDEAINDPHLTVGKYHDIRKKIRDYMNLFDLLDTQSPRPEFASTGAFLARLSKKMGKVKDGLLDEAYQGKKDTAASESAPTSIDSESFEDLQRFVQLMKSATNGR